MKRAILLSSLAVSIIGTLSFSIIANIEGNKNLKMSMDYVVGGKTSLEDLQVKQEIIKGEYAKKTLLISKDGVKDEGVKFSFTQDDKYIKDKKLFRGIEQGCFAENKDFSVIVEAKNKKGMFIRYKHNDNYKEFNVVNNVIEYYNPGNIYNVFLKDEEVYLIYKNNKSENFLIKINLISEKMVENIKLPTTEDMYFASKGNAETGYIIKDNKVYIPALGIDYDIRLFCYDLSTKNLSFKDIKNVMKLKETSMHRMVGDEIYFISYDSKGNLEISSYNLIDNKSQSINTKLPIEVQYRYLGVDQIKVTENYIHLCGGIVDNNNESTGFIAGFDKKSNSIKYFSKLNDCSKLTYRLMIQ